jgi:phosphoenolpyruvate carboxykinase (ATP)
VWLVNTGWTGGPYGVGSRMKIAHTRAMINAALSGALATVAVQRDPIFNLDVPTNCPGVSADVLNPRNTWQDKNAYDQMARKLARMFVDNFTTFEATASPAVKAAGPKG